MMSHRAPIFVGGLMKSGTSLVRKLLSRHSQIYGGLETHWFSDDLMKSWRDPSTQRARWMREFFEVSESDYAALAQSASSGPDLLDRFMWLCTERADKKRWVEKTPDNILYLPTIWKHWPDALAIHVIRDLRDIYASWKRNQKRTLGAFIDNVRQVRRTIGALATQETVNYLEVRYEQLVTEPENAMRRVASFAGVPWESALAEYEGDESDFNKVLAVTGKESPTTASLAKPIFTSSVGQWREILSPQEVERLQQELSDELELWGWSAG